MQTIWFLYLPNIGADGLPKQKQYDTCKNVFIHIFFKKKTREKEIAQFLEKIRDPMFKNLRRLHFKYVIYMLSSSVIKQYVILLILLKNILQCIYLDVLCT